MAVTVVLLDASMTRHAITKRRQYSGGICEVVQEKNLWHPEQGYPSSCQIYFIFFPQQSQHGLDAATWPP
jgi:hypothetical protein